MIQHKSVSLLQHPMGHGTKLMVEPSFPIRVLVKGGPPVTKSQLRVLWHLKHGARVDTWLGSLPTARMWTEDEAVDISTATIRALSQKKLIRPLGRGASNRDAKSHRGSWDLTQKGRELVADYP